MILAFLCLASSKLPEYNLNKFGKEIKLPKNKNEVYVFLFYTPFCKKFKEYYSALEYSNVLTNGTVKYGTVNCQGERKLCDLFKIKEYPTIIIKNRTNTDEFVNSLNPSVIAKTAMNYISSKNVKIVDDFWIDDYRDKPTSILFTKKEKIPGYFKALSRSFSPKKIRFGICNDEGLFNDYRIKETPVIMFYYKNNTIKQNHF